jgi:hypothetical protein
VPTPGACPIHQGECRGVQSDVRSARASAFGADGAVRVRDVQPSHRDTTGHGRPACCLSCYAHWWADECGHPTDCSEPFSPYTYTLAALRQIPPPPPHKPAPIGLLPRITSLNFWQSSLSPEFVSFPGDWDSLERLAPIEAEVLSDHFEKRHREGEDARALPEFLAHSAYALKQPWVIDQLVAWRVDGTRTSIARLKAALAAVTDSRGRPAARTGELRQNIERNIKHVQIRDRADPRGRRSEGRRHGRG